MGQASLRQAFSRRARAPAAMLHSPDGTGNPCVFGASVELALVRYLTTPLLTTQVPKVSGVCSISEKPAAIIALRSFSAFRKVSTERGR